MKIKDLLKHNPEAEIVLTLKRDGRTTFFGCGALAEISLKDTDTPYLEFVLVDNAPDHVLQKNLELKEKEERKEKKRKFNMLKKRHKGIT